LTIEKSALTGNYAGTSDSVGAPTALPVPSYLMLGIWQSGRTWLFNNSAFNVI